MADREKTVDVLIRLQIGEIDEEWVKAVWEGDFDADSLPLALEEDFQAHNYHVQTFKSAQAALTPWAEGREAIEGEGFWSVLVEQDLSYKSLVALLSSIIDLGQKRIATGIQKEAGIAAAGLYLILLKIPGSGAFKIFHPMLFEKAVKSFKCWSQLGGGSKRKRKSVSPVRSSQGKKRSKSRRREAEINNATNPFAADEEEEEEEEEGVLSQAEINRIQMALIQLLRIYVGFLSSYTLRDCEQSAYVSLQTLAELSKLEPETFQGVFRNNVEINQMMTVPQLAYKGLELLCSESHGDQATMITAVFKNLLPSVLMLIGENKGVAAQTVPRSTQMIKDHAVNFVRHLMNSVPSDAVMPAVRVLLQHMCSKVPDKAEYRSKVAQSIVMILRDSSAGFYARIVEWLYKYSRAAQISWRGFALDVACLLLSEAEKADDNVAEDMSVFLSHHFLIQMILSRCSDVAPTVRSRAITIFAHCMTSQEPGITGVVREIMTPQVAGGRGPMTRIIPTPDPNRVAPPTDKSQTEDTTAEATVPASGNATPIPPENNTRSLIPSIPPSIRRFLTASAMVTPDNHGQHAALTPGDTNAAMVTIQLTPGLEITLSDGRGVTSMLRRRAGDEKVNVRKSALQALEGVIRLTEGDNINKQDLDIIEERCRDPALSVRKQALQCLTSLLTELPHCNLIQMAWLNGCFPMVLDRETGAQEKCLELIEEIILDNIVATARSTSDHHQMAWELLNLTAGGEQVELRRFLQKACQHWGRTGKLKPAITTALKSHVNTENNDGAWMLLAEMAPFAAKFDTDFVVEYWQEHARSAEESHYSTVGRVLVVLSHIAKNIPPETCSVLSDDLKSRLMEFNSPPELTAATVTTLNKLCLAQCQDKQAVKKLTDMWFGDLLRACDTYLSKVILDENPDSALDEDRIIRHLFTLGEMAQLCPAQTPKRVFMLVQSLIAAPVISADGSLQSMPESFSQPASQDVSGSSQGSQPSSQVSQTSEPQSQASQSSQPFSVATQDVLSQFKGSRMSSRVRAHAFLTLGKLCLQNQELAKKCVPALARELEVSHDPTVRNNIVIIMADLCIRYTTLVDRYVSNISSCLKDDSPLIRKQCLTLLTRLLQEDFLKWKGSLFFHFIITIVDELKEIQEFSEYCLVHMLMQRHPAMFYHHFVECIFHFNSYDEHMAYNKFSQSEREKKLFSLRGRQNFDKRMRIYKFLLEHMTDEHRFQLTAKLCTDILAAVVDGIMPLDGNTSALLQDTLNILSSKEIKLATMRSKPQDEVAETEQEMAAVVMNVAKKTLITQVFKKNVMENIVPTVISLKYMLEKNRSPVLKDLMLFMRELMKDYKTEVKDILAADRQLANEIEFDLRKFEEREKEEQLEKELQLRRSAANSPRTSPVVSPNVHGRNSPLPSPRLRVPRSPRTPPGTPSRPPGTPKAVGTPKNQQGTPKNQQETPKNQQGTPKNQQGTIQYPSNPVNPAMPGPEQMASISTPSPKTPVPSNRHLTPARAMTMSMVAVMNSARKAMETAKKVRKDLQESQCSTTSQQSKKVGFVSPDVSENPFSGTGTPQSNSFKTPERQRTRGPKNHRAISTPSANLTLGNITFHQGDLSMIAASPSARAIQQGLTTPSWTTRVVETEEGERREDILSLFSPEKPPPKSKKWNIKTPPGRKVTTPNDVEDDQISDISATQSTPGDPTPTRSGRRKATKEPLDPKPINQRQSNQNNHVEKPESGRRRSTRSKPRSKEANSEETENVTITRNRRTSSRNRTK